MAGNSNRSRELEQRMMDFAMGVILIARTAPKTVDNRVIIEQMIKSASSIGANYTEANNAASRQDFKNKVFIAKKEAAETRYWLQLFRRINPDLDVKNLVAEATELILILQKIVTTLQNGQ
ncbi:MAG: four helix bundle protein [Candidatus Saccharimonadales bacterium]|jgi:four helix bundle protein